jgi:hypothetical protein
VNDDLMGVKIELSTDKNTKSEFNEIIRKLEVYIFIDKV